jgi:hypothetical protein
MPGARQTHAPQQSASESSPEPSHSPRKAAHDNRREGNTDPDAGKMHIAKLRVTAGGQVLQHEGRGKDQHAGAGQTTQEADRGKEDNAIVQRHHAGRQHAAGQADGKACLEMATGKGGRAERAQKIAEEVCGRDETALGGGERYRLCHIGKDRCEDETTDPHGRRKAQEAAHRETEGRDCRVCHDARKLP